MLSPLLYIDPGAGSIILQALLAGLAGLVVFVKYQGRRITAFFRGQQSGPEDSDET